MTRIGEVVSEGNALQTTGGTLTGDLVFPSTGFVMDCGTKKFRVQIDCSGNLHITPVTTNAGLIIGFPFGLTYAS